MNLWILINFPTIPKPISMSVSFLEQVQEYQIFLQISVCLATPLPFLKKPKKDEIQ